MEKILVLDFGGQYAHLIAKRIRHLGYYSEITLPSTPVDDPIFTDVRGIVLSGGPSSVYDEKVPEFNEKVLSLDVPILGLCYGHQLMNKVCGGDVKSAKVGEYGFAVLNKVAESPLFDGIDLPAQVWMSHSDEVTEIGDGFEIAASTKDCKYAVVQNLQRKMFGIQCHIEVNDTPIGDDIFANFIRLTGMQVNWDQDKVLNTIMESVKVQAKDKKVLLFLSGGVDSTVAFALLNKALGQDRVLGLHIDNGFMRQDESKHVCDTYRSFGFTNFIAEDASDTFLNAVAGLTDPQAKRKAVGETFITVRDQVVAKLNLDEDQWMLAQGTLYPDIIESGGSKNAHVIKTHHNRVDGIQKLIAKGLIIEPLKDLYKDEVRVMGKSLGLSDKLVYRHPFPGPGISINTLCSDGVWTADDANNIQAVNDKLAKIDLSKWTDIPAKLYALPVKSVGVQGDFRTYAHPAVLDMDDFVGVKFDWDKAEEISSHITNNVKDVNRTIVKLFDKTGGNAKLLKAYCTKDRLDMIRAADKIVLDTLYKYDWYNKIFQHLTICLPFASADGKCSIVLRPVVSEDVMTARFAKLPYNIMEEIVENIKKMDFIDALYYDITNKPPATFGWE